MFALSIQVQQYKYTSYRKPILLFVKAELTWNLSLNGKPLSTLTSSFRRSFLWFWIGAQLIEVSVSRRIGLFTTEAIVLEFKI